MLGGIRKISSTVSTVKNYRGTRKLNAVLLKFLWIFIIYLQNSRQIRICKFQNDSYLQKKAPAVTLLFKRFKQPVAFVIQSRIMLPWSLYWRQPNLNNNYFYISACIACINVHSRDWLSQVGYSMWLAIALVHSAQLHFARGGFNQQWSIT